MNPPDDPLHSACAQGDLPAVKDLIARYLTADPSYNPPFSSMLYAAARSDRVDIARYCLDHQALINPETIKILMINRSKAVYELLLDSHAVDVNFYIPWFGDILSNVARANDFDWTRLCLSHGADPNLNLVDEYMSILASVAESEKGSSAMAELLIKHGAQVKGSGAIVMAAAEGKSDMVKFLLSKGADINEMGIEQPTDPRYKEDVGTALHRAVVGGHTEVVTILLEEGADIEVRDLMGKTALDLAREQNNANIAKLLEERVE